MTGPHLLLINPWIYDFAAYDLWARPLGLLYLASILTKNGFSVDVIDCLLPETEEPFNSCLRNFGTGKFLRTILPKPCGLKDVPRAYSRYGISAETFRSRLKSCRPPAAVLVTSLMTYWYPGPFEVIRHAKALFPETPVILGGIYATLCVEHARKYSHADYVLPGQGERSLPTLLSDLTGHPCDFLPDPGNFPELPYPAFDLLNGYQYICLMTSRGCPFRCAYCASNKLYPSFSRRCPESVIEEINYWNKTRGIADFAFYDDALLVAKESHIWPILEKLVQKQAVLRFHTPNALHIKEIDMHTADLLFRSGFKTIRLGFETADMGRHKELDKKIEEGDLPHAVTHLRKAGFKPRDIGVYIMAGLPGQQWNEVSDSVSYVRGAGAVPYLAEYSPIPESPLWNRALQCARYPIAEDPLYQNNSLLPCAGDFSWEKVQKIKMQVRAARTGI